MEVTRLPKIAGSGLRYALNFPLFLNPIWLFSIWRVIRRTRPDLLIVCDLPLAPCAVWFGGLFTIPVHYDMAEVYPEFLRSLRLLERQGPLKRLIRSPSLARLVERYVLRRVSCTYVVSEESKARAISLHVPPERLVIVGNTPESLPSLDSPGPVPDDIADLVSAGREILLFVGILISDRGVTDAVRALPTLHARFPRATLIVVGDGPARTEVEREVRRLKLEKSVRVVGWRLPEDLDGYYAAAHLGLLPFRDSPHVRLTLANKLFDYMGAGLPVLGSDLPPTRRVLDESGAGRTHVPDDPEDLGRVAAEMLADPAGRLQMGRSGRRAAELRYAWHQDAARLCDAALRRPQISVS